MIAAESKRSPNLSLNMSIYLREVHGERLVAVMGVDFCGNTDLAVGDDYWCTTETRAFDESQVPSPQRRLG